MEQVQVVHFGFLLRNVVVQVHVQVHSPLASYRPMQVHQVQVHLT